MFAVYLLAATAKGVTGLGFSTTCLPFLVMTVGLKEALPLLLIPSVASNLQVMYGAGGFRQTVARFWPMFLATIPGLLLGLWILGDADGAALGAILGAVLLAYVAFAYANPNVRLPDGWERPLQPASGVLTGLLNGLTGSQVMPSMPFLMALDLDRNMFVQAINCSFTLSSIIMAAGLVQLGLMTEGAVLVSAIGIIWATTGVRLGERIRHRLSPDQFRMAVLIMLAGMGVALIMQGL
ncbi:MAG: sulfite exporter TauE/SafE family protein [Pseudomonadota bacterium]